MLKFLLYIYHGRLALMGIYACLTARHLTYIYCIYFFVLYLNMEAADDNDDNVDAFAAKFETRTKKNAESGLERGCSGGGGVSKYFVSAAF